MARGENRAESDIDLAETQCPVIILKGEMPHAVLQDIARYEATQKTLALLKVLAMTTQAVNDGKLSPAADAFAWLWDRLPRPE